MRSIRFALVTAAGVLAAFAAAKQVVVNQQKTSLSKDQELQIGKEAAAQVEREKEIIHNAEVEKWLNQIGQTLAKTPQANAYPYCFKVVNDESINAFALPGGPMYVHTGLLRAADSEGEVAGVLAHEMSHVALRHGAAQMTKEQRWGTLFGVVGALGGALTTDQNGNCGFFCQATQGVTGFAENTTLMKFSRGYERDADLNGARMAAAAGYDPINLPQFFEKLERTQGTAAEPRGLALWMASHPATGSRIQYVSDDIRFYPKKAYTASTGTFARVKSIVAALPPPKLQPGTLIMARQGATPRTNLPNGLKDYVANGFSVGVPDTWQVGQVQGGGSLYMVPQGGLKQAQNAGPELIFGAMVDYFVTTQGGTVNLEAATGTMVDGLKKGDANLRAERSTRTTVGGRPALLTKITTKTSAANAPDQTVLLYTVAREAGLWHLVLAAPTSQMGEAAPAFNAIVETVQFPN